MDKKRRVATVLLLMALLGCTDTKNDSKGTLPPELELDQDEDPYPDEYLQDFSKPVNKKREVP